MTKRNVVHIEIPSRDEEESGRFYSELFGWQITPVPEMSYALWEPGTPPGGGFSPLGENVKAGDVLIFVDSQDIEADLKKAEKLGGQVLRPKTEITGTGWFGIFKDPTGNAIALFTGKDPDVNQ